MSISHSITIEGKPCTLVITSGRVLDYKERSDTHVYGSGSVSNGHGSSYVSSSVSITADLWIQEYKTGKEIHLEYGDAIGVRVGNIVHHIALNGLGKSPILVSIYNAATNQSVDFYENNNVWKEFLQTQFPSKLTGMYLLIGGVGGFILGILMQFPTNGSFNALVMTWLISIGIGVIMFAVNVDKNKNNERKQAHFGEEMLKVVNQMFTKTYIDEVNAEFAKSTPVVVTEKQSNSNPSFCKECGTSLAPESKFCGGCGLNLELV